MNDNKIPDMPEDEELATLLNFADMHDNGLVKELAAAVRALQTEVYINKHKADQYDSVVRELSVADNGRYREDTIQAIKQKIDKYTRLLEVAQQQNHTLGILKWGHENKMAEGLEYAINSVDYLTDKFEELTGEVPHE